MSILFSCDSCLARLRIHERGAGHIVYCPHCGETLQVPTPARPAATEHEGCIGFECPGCEAKYAVEQEGAGSRVRCPGCGLELVVPDAPFSADLGRLTDDEIDFLRE